MEPSEGNQIKLNDLTPEQALEVLWQLLNKSNKTGAFSIDESYTIKVLVDKLAVALKQNK